MTDDERKSWELIKRQSLGMFREACRRLSEVNTEESDFADTLTKSDGSPYGVNVPSAVAPVQRRLNEWREKQGL